MRREYKLSEPGRVLHRHMVNNSGNQGQRGSGVSWLPPPDRASFYNVDTGEEIIFKVNPGDLRRSENVNWIAKPSPGSVGPDYQYGGGGERRITINLILDATDSHIDNEGVLKQLSKIELLTYPRGEQGLLDSQFFGPPTILFQFGPRVWEVVINSLNIRETHHDVRLQPIFVRVSVDMMINLLYSDANEGLHSQRVNWSGSK